MPNASVLELGAKTRNRVTMSSKRPKVIDDTWQLTAKLGRGSFGKVYKGKNIQTGEQVAVKIAQDYDGDERLQIEYDVYKGLRNTPTEIVGVPRVHYFGKDRSHNVLVMDLLGNTLEETLRDCGGKLSIKSTLMIGIQLLRRLQLVHHKGYIHRDVKPGNMLIGLSDDDRVYLLDFGVSEQYRDYETREHIKRAEERTIVGSVPFISINAHSGASQSPRDDLESLGYSLVYLFKGKLPWQDFKIHLLPWQQQGTKANLRLYRKLGVLKTKISLEKLCEDMPRSMIKYFRYVKGLESGARPNYAKLRGILRKGLEEEGLVEDRDFDWMQIRKGVSGSGNGRRTQMGITSRT